MAPRGAAPKWMRALLQSGLVAVYLFVAFLVVYQFHSKLAIVSLAASAFIAFGFPEADSARPRFMIGGYVCGVVCGAGCALLYRLVPEGGPHDMLVRIGFCVLGVFLTSLAMILLDLQHPPAAALAAAMVLEERPLAMALTMVVCVVALCGARRLALSVLGRAKRGASRSEKGVAAPGKIIFRKTEKDEINRPPSPYKGQGRWPE